MELALTIVSLIVGVVSIVLAIFSMLSTKKTQDRIIENTKKIKKSIDGKDE